MGFTGDVHFVNGGNGPQVKVTGDSVLEEFRANSAVAKLTGSAAPSGNAGGSGGSGCAGAMDDLKISEELWIWDARSLRGVDVTVEPDTTTPCRSVKRR